MTLKRGNRLITQLFPFNRDDSTRLLSYLRTRKTRQGPSISEGHVEPLRYSLLAGLVGPRALARPHGRAAEPARAA